MNTNKKITDLEIEASYQSYNDCNDEDNHYNNYSNHTDSFQGRNHPIIDQNQSEISLRESNRFGGHYTYVNDNNLVDESDHSYERQSYVSKDKAYSNDMGNINNDFKPDVHPNFNEHMGIRNVESRTELNGFLLSPNMAEKQSDKRYPDQKQKYVDSDMPLIYDQSQLNESVNNTVKKITQQGYVIDKPLRENEPKMFKFQNIRMESNDRSSINYAAMYEEERKISEVKDHKIVDLEDQIQKLKAEKMSIIKNYERLIKKMVLVKDIEKEYAKISVVHDSASEELKELKQKVDRFEENQDSLVSTDRVSIANYNRDKKNNYQNQNNDAATIQIKDTSKNRSL